jgi:sterol-4alpha-carboxylate 3-dehydrogenase (decarboxylating)
VIGTGWALFIARLLELVLGIFGKQPTFNRMSVRFSAMTRYHSIVKAKQRLGYEPLVSLEEGIRRGVPEVMGRFGWDKKGAAEKKTQ